MGWAYSYLKGISKEDVKGKCPKRKKNKKHKVEFWFGSLYCEKCNAELEYKVKN